jgi:hypothetical protein
MPNTTNYNWATPADTDLVKDGAAAIRTLGSSIDTTTKNLNPQTTTGALAYRSATANVNTALPIGSTGDILTVAGGVPTWAAPAAGASFVGCSVFATSGTSLTSGTQTAIAYNDEHFDTDAIHSTSVNNTRFTIPSGKDGKWHFTFRTYFSTNSTGGRYLLPRKNGTNIKAAETMASSAGAFTLEINFILNLVATDYIENFVLQTSGSTLTAQSDTVYTEASCFYLGA